jgi:hypothetical protein
MGRRPSLGASLLALASCVASCGPAPGSDGAQLPVPFSHLGGGIVFATSRLIGSAGYDLYWIPLPAVNQVTPQVPVRLTSADGDERQPSVSASGNAIVFATDDGILAITSSGRFRRISKTTGMNLYDSIPAVSPNADRVAWVREDHNRPIAGSNGFETYVMLANFDGSNAQPASPKDGIIQDAPAFSPDPMASKLAWTEFNATTIDPNTGPHDYGVWVHDYKAISGHYVCRSAPDGHTIGAEMLMRDIGPYRCFGEHLAWPAPNVLVLGQDLLEIHTDTGELVPVWQKVIDGINMMQIGQALTQTLQGAFFPAFPLSVNYAPDGSRFVFDGLMGSTDSTGNDGLAILTASSDGTSVYRVPVQGYGADYDPYRTANYTFSWATPQIIPYWTP